MLSVEDNFGNLAFVLLFPFGNESNLFCHLAFLNTSLFFLELSIHRLLVTRVTKYEKKCRISGLDDTHCGSHCHFRCKCYPEILAPLTVIVKLENIVIMREHALNVTTITYVPHLWYSIDGDCSKCSTSSSSDPAPSSNGPPPPPHASFLILVSLVHLIL